MNDIYLFTNCNKLENIQPKISGSILGDRVYSQYHTIKYDKNKRIKIQSPLCKVFSKNHNWLNNRMAIEEKKNVVFLDHLKSLMTKLQKITQKKYTKQIIWENMKSYNGSKMFNCKIYPGCLCFDNKGNKLKIDDKIVNATIDFIFEISTIQIICPFDEKDILFGKINIDILQIRKHTLFDQNIQENMFHDVTHSPTKHEGYFKYFDMLKKGVPKQAVELKMSSEGIDPSILNDNIYDENRNTNINKIQNHSKMNKILSNDLKNVKLKKITNLKSKTKRISMGVSLGISLEAIQNSLKSLRKTCI